MTKTYDDQQFKELVDHDIRNGSYRDLLKTPDMVRRWHAVLTGMSMDVNNQLDLKQAEFEAKSAEFRLHVLRCKTADEEKAAEIDYLQFQETYHKVRSRSLRFKMGVEKVLVIAEYERSIQFPENQQLIKELGKLAAENTNLISAIIRYRDDPYDDESEAQERLFKVLPDEII